MKKIITIVLAALMILALAGCGAEKTESTNSKQSSVSSSAEKAKCNVYALNGPTGMGLVSLMKKSEDGKAKLDYNIKTVGANDEIVAKLTNKEADIAAVATNVASLLYKKTNGGISVLAENTLGVLCLVTKGETVTDIKSLKGKTIYATGKGANPEYIINYILEKNGLKAGTDVTINFVAEPTELVATVTTNDKAIIIAPQPIATTLTVKDQAASIVLDLNDEWNKVTDTKLVMGCIVARKEYIDQNPDAVKTFMEEYNESVESVNSDNDTAASLCEKYGITTNAAIAKKALPYCNIVYTDGTKMKTDLAAYLDFLYKNSPEAVGGALPADDFYYASK